jgi:hypothetical protein
MESFIEANNVTMFLLSNFDMSEKWTNSKFYYEVISSLYSINKDNQIHKEHNILDQYLPYNKYLKTSGKHVCFKELTDAGIWKVHDLFDNEGKPLTFETLESRGISKNKYIYWRKVILTVKNLSTDTLPVLNTSENQYSLNVELPTGNNINLQHSKTKHIYENLVMLKSEIPKSFAKFANIFDSFNSTCYENVCLIPRACTNNNGLKDLQYQILHKYLPTNHLLFKMGKIESMRCTFCNLQSETIVHLFFECTCVIAIWTYIVDILRAIGYENVSLTCKDVVLGYEFEKHASFSNHKEINNVILYVKSFIWHSRKHCTDIDIEQLGLWLRKQNLYDRSINDFCEAM